MDLRELAAQDGHAILEDDGATVILVSPASVSYSVRAQVVRVGIDLNADGLPVPADKSTVTISTLELAEAGLDIDALKSGTWTITTADVMGAEISGTLFQPLLDRTLGRVTATIKRTV